MEQITMKVIQKQTTDIYTKVVMITVLFQQSILREDST